jgi:hypothetical protein
MKKLISIRWILPIALALLVSPLTPQAVSADGPGDDGIGGQDPPMLAGGGLVSGARAATFDLAVRMVLNAMNATLL